MHPQEKAAFVRRLTYLLIGLAIGFMLLGVLKMMKPMPPANQVNLPQPAPEAK
ncbi:MAG: hypothetical protein AABZ53_14855 [Planctomycetota bacterium]